jgi:hypothetical protein
MNQKQDKKRAAEYFDSEFPMFSPKCMKNSKDDSFERLKTRENSV